MLNSIFASIRNFLWEHVVLGALSLVFDHWWIAAIVVGLLVALAWKVYTILGWRGALAVIVVIISLGLVQVGWRLAIQRHQYDKFPDAPPQPFPSPRGIFDSVAPPVPYPEPQPVQHAPPPDYTPFGSPENTPKPHRPRPPKK